MSEESGYNLRGKKQGKRIRPSEQEVELTYDGYMSDGFVVPDSEDGLFCFGLRSGTADLWKEGLDPETVEQLEPELKKIRALIEEENPTIPKILTSNITLEDKKRAIQLYYQLQSFEPHTPEHTQLSESINNIIRKGKNHTKKVIKKLEKIEKRLKKLASPPDNLKNQILLLNAPESTKAIIYSQYLEMLEHEPGSQSYNSIREEIEWAVKLPYNTVHTEVDFTNMDKEELTNYYHDFLTDFDSELYGMENIKMKMLHITNNRITSGGKCGTNVAIAGPPGTGKTAVGKAYAKILGIPFEKISVGGMADASIFKGSNKVWQSSGPSIVLQILARIKSSSGVVMFDEMDKLGETSQGREVQYALLHITDYIHNSEFKDNYLNKFPHDFSKILFMFAMNTPDNLDPALLNRLDIIWTRAYTSEEKINITSNYVLPRTLELFGMNPKSVTIDRKAAHKLGIKTQDDPGVRDIEKIIVDLVGKINMYRSIAHSDGSIDIDLGYEIPRFKLPLKITTKLLIDLNIIDQ